MASTNAKQVDALGFDRMEIANVRRAYGANKVNYSKLNKLYEKAAELKTKIDGLLEAIRVWDAPARALAVEKVGVELSSEEILLAHEDINKFYEIHPEMKPAEETGTAEAEQAPVAEPEAQEGPEL